ncbi:MAG: hypothetical protein WCO99_05035 [Planctomycetota bacterium]
MRQATRNAPAHVKRAIDRERQRHGEAPLWNVERRSEPNRSHHVVIVGACCPGRSSPVTAATDGLHIPEEIAPTAFDHTLRCIKARATEVVLEAGHGGDTLASTADGTLSFMRGTGTGLMMVARVKSSRMNAEMLAYAMAGKMGLSVSMVPRRMEVVKRNGRSLRLIHEVELKGVAALWRAGDHGKACYPAARAYAAFEHDKASVRRVMRRAGIEANTAMLKAGWCD